MPNICRCGHSNSDSALHCENCGERLVVEKKEYAPYQNDPYKNTQYSQSVAYAQPQYVQPVVAQAVTQGENPVSIGAWVGLIVLFCIPFVNLISLIIVLCVAENKTLKNYVIANFIIAGSIVVLTILLFFLLGASAIGLAELISNTY